MQWLVGHRKQAAPEEKRQSPLLSVLCLLTVDMMVTDGLVASVSIDADAIYVIQTARVFVFDEWMMVLGTKRNVFVTRLAQISRMINNACATPVCMGTRAAVFINKSVCWSVLGPRKIERAHTWHWSNGLVRRNGRIRLVSLHRGLCFWQTCHDDDIWWSNINKR